MSLEYRSQYPGDYRVKGLGLGKKGLSWEESLILALEFVGRGQRYWENLSVH